MSCPELYGNMMMLVHTQAATHELQAILDDTTGKFNTPKPSTLISRILQIGSNKDSVILDSFAGSGTTAHAVLALNKEDGGNRKFILVECEDYADTITAERVRRVIKGIPDAPQQVPERRFGWFLHLLHIGRSHRHRRAIDGREPARLSRIGCLPATYCIGYLSWGRYAGI